MSNGYGLCDLHRNQSVETSQNRPRRAEKEKETFLLFSVAPFVFLISSEKKCQKQKGTATTTIKLGRFHWKFMRRVTLWLVGCCCVPFSFGWCSCCSGAYIVAVVAFTFQIEIWLVAISTLKNNMQRDICVTSYQLNPPLASKNISPSAAAACFHPASLGGA